jgi:hypothetical protein
MSLYVDENFLNAVGYRLRNFKKKSNGVWNFSCPICGDSKKNKLKARGYIIKGKTSLVYKCHNCSCAISFSDLLKELDPALHKEYMFESYLEGKPEEEQKIITIAAAKKAREKSKITKTKIYRPAKPTIMIGCPSIASLEPPHPARLYLEWRQIPSKFFYEIYWAEDFPALAKKLDPNKILGKKEGRIIMPFLDQDGQVIAMQGRCQPAFDEASGKWKDEPDAIRYITIKAFEEASRIYGLNRLSKSLTKRVYVVEGPIDSLFLPNCVAMAGSDIPPEFAIDRTVVVYDNEPRKPGTVEKINKAIDRGYRVCIWPDTVNEKDINAMVMNGMPEAKIRDLIDSNSYMGLEAKLKLQHWANPTGRR